MKTKILMKPPNHKLQEVFIRLDEGNGIKLLVNCDETLAELMTRIKNSPLLLPQEFSLVYLGMHLKTLEKSVKDLEIQNKGIIHIENLVPSSIKEVKIDVGIYYKDETTIVSVKARDTICSLKQKLAKIVNILPKHQIIVFRGKQLDNKKTLESYHIKSNSLLCLTSQTDQEELETALPLYLNFQAPQKFDCISSVQMKERKNSKSMFSSEIFEDRPAYQIVIKQKDDTFEHNLNEFGKQFNFEQLYPKISELVIEKRPFLELDYSCDFDSSSSCSISLAKNPTAFKKNSLNLVFN